MKFRKLISFALISALSVSATVNAAEYLPVDISGTTLRIKTDNPDGERIISMITKKDAPLSDAELFGVYETDGEVLEFIMPDFHDEIDGEYTLYVSGKESGNFCYSSEQMREYALSELKKDNADYEALFSAESEYYYAYIVMGYDIPGYMESDSKEDILRIFGKSGDISGESFNKSVAVMSIKAEKDISPYLEKINPEFDGKKYTDADSKLKTWINTYMEKSDIDSVAEFDSEYKTANILYLFNNAKFAEIADLFSEYDSDLGLDDYGDYKDYKGLSRTKKDKVHDYIVSKFTKNECTSVSTLKDVLSDAVESVDSNNKNSSNKGTGGGGGGGGGGSTGGGNNLFFPTEKQKKEDVKLPEETPDEPVFDDLDSVSWAKEAILALYGKGIVSGDGNGKFNPNDTVTREQFVKMLVIASGLKAEKGDNCFEDVDSSAWYADYVLSAYKSGVVNGVSDTLFGIGNLIKRQDMAVMAYRALGDRKLSDVREAAEFTDGGKISEYAKEAVGKLYTAGKINGMGDNMFNPEGTATRAESAMIIYNIFVK